MFLGTIAVAPRTDLKRRLEQEGLLEDESLDSALHRHLMEIFSLPSAASVENPVPTDLVLDVLIPKFQSGEIIDVGLGEIALTLLWRPRITVTSRLYF